MNTTVIRLGAAADYPHKEKPRRGERRGEGWRAFRAAEIRYTAQSTYARAWNAGRRPAGKWGKGARE